MKGLDPVHLCQGREVEGQSELTETRGRYTYRFADPESREHFLADPERWAIQWGGACGRMGPMKGRGAIDRWTVHEGRIWIFASDGCRAGFLSAPERFTAPPSKAPKANPAALAEGRLWIERAVVAHGGEAVDQPRSLRLIAISESDGFTHELELHFDAEGRVRRRSLWIPNDSDATGFETTWVVAEDAFVVEDGTTHDLVTAAERADVRRYAHREPLLLLWLRNRQDFVAIPKGPSELAGRATFDVLVHVQGLATTLHLDPETAQVQGLSWTGRPNDGVTRKVTESFGKSETRRGITMPSTCTVHADGEEMASFATRWLHMELEPSLLAAGLTREKVVLESE